MESVIRGWRLMQFCPFVLLCTASIANAQPALDAGTVLDAEMATTTNTATTTTTAWPTCWM